MKFAVFVEIFLPKKYISVILYDALTGKFFTIKSFIFILKGRNIFGLFVFSAGF